MQRRTALAFGALACTLSGAPAIGQTGEIRIAHIYSKTGFLEAYGKQTAVGLMMGLDYATGGTMQVAGKKLVVIERDDQGRPDVGRSLLAAAYADDKADLAVGPTSSGVALAMLPVAAQYKKILVVAPAAADSITGERRNKYVFRTSPNTSQTAIANAVVFDKPGLHVATLAPDFAFGRESVLAFRNVFRHARLVHEEYLPTNTTDFTAGTQRLIDSLKGKPGRKVIFIIWPSAGNPFKIVDMNLGRHGIEVSTIGSSLAAMTALKNFPGLEGATSYYYGIPNNPMNDALLARHQALFKTPPEFFTATGFSAAMAVVTALERSAGDARAGTLIKVMEGMGFDTPIGRMTFRKEDHQAMQSLYHFKIRVDPAVAWGVPELVRELRPEDMQVPIYNNR